MIITRTPLRISFFSGGSDLPSFYEKEKGAALSCTIDKYIDVIVRENPNHGVRTVYDEIDEVDDLSLMRHAITREALEEYSFKQYIKNYGLTISSMSDIKGTGSGLGSSSAFTVGLTNALTNFYGRIDEPQSYYAEIACKIEMERCKFPVGKQDQYAAAYGGFNLFEFEKEGVTVHKPRISIDTLIKLQRNLLLVYSGKGRSANTILQKQQAAMVDEKKFDLVRRSRDLAYVTRRYLENGDVDSFGNLLHQSWLDKKEVVKEISQTYFDEIYDFMLQNGALGGKLLGAGGGGFFIFYMPDSTHIKRNQLEKKLINSFPLCVIHDFRFTHEGSKILFQT